MGFRQGAFAKVWEVKSKNDTSTDLRISISRKNKKTEAYEQEFTGYVTCFGADVAKRAAALSEGDRIKLGDVDVTNRYDKEKGITYTTFKVFGFENPDAGGGHTTSASVDDGEIDENNHLPF